MPTKSKGKYSPLLFADSEHNADMLYLGRVFVPDAFIAFVWNRRSYAVVNRLEYNRIVNDSDFDKVLSYESLVDAAKQAFKIQRPKPEHLIRLLAKQLDIPGWQIPQDFPAGIALALRDAGVKLTVAEGSTLFPDRETKTDDEAKHIQAGNAASAAGLRIAQEMLEKAEISRGYLYLDGKRLTSERVREAIDIACLKKGAVASHTIVAGGEQACDPHCTGSGPLRSNELIIVDIFPRITQTGYHGDMTRTFLKGRANDAQRGIANAVNEAQKAAIATIKARVKAAKVHAAVEAVFDEAGYKTQQREDGAYEGFFHSTGHGLGLQVHEAPRLSPLGPNLRSGMVVTVEPGLYYPGIGGFRTEDVVRVTADGCEYLSSFNYRWELR